MANTQLKTKSVVAQQAPVAIEQILISLKPKVDKEYEQDGYEPGIDDSAFNNLKKYEYIRKAMLYAWYNGGKLDAKGIYCVYNTSCFNVLTKKYKVLIDYKSPFFIMYQKNSETGMWDIIYCNKEETMNCCNQMIKQYLGFLFD